VVKKEKKIEILP